MVKNALGLIEVVGLAAGMAAADTAVKAANVELIGYELAKGGGMVLIKVSGDVGAVKAAVDAAAAAAAKINKVVSKHVIPRPHSELGGLIITQETVGQTPAPAGPVQVEPPAAETPVNPVETDTESTVSAAVAVEPALEDLQVTAPETLDQEPVNPSEICNLCGDPACPRKKGDPRITCIHYDKNNKEDE
jgi:ethanolamine utilization protein EutM